MKILFGFFFTVALALTLALVYIYDQVKEQANKVIDYHPKLTTVIYDKQNKVLANVFDGEHRLYATYDEIPPRLIEALVAIEDTSFFEHRGVNPEAVMRAIIKDLKAGKLVEGASTLTQQLTKNLALTREKKIVRKLKEMVLSTIVETTLSKEEILERYLNDIYLGHGYYGVKTAALGYFHKKLHELTLKEIAIIVGLPKAPSFYDPTKHLNLSLNRANTVLKRLHTLGWINKDELTIYLDERPLVYSESRTQNNAPYIVSEVKKRLSKLYPNYRTMGLQIYTTVDLSIQTLALKSLQHAQTKVLSRKPKNPKEVNGAMVVLENHTGNILALIGGVNPKTSHYNRATQARRQPGSGFKPFVYLCALNQGYAPVSKIADISRIYETGETNSKQWKPKNYEGNYKGEMTLREALIHSRNLATINLSREVGLDIVHKEIEKMGFKNVPFNLSFVLGSFGASPLQMAEAYTVITNYGTRIESRLIDHIVFQDGSSNILPTHTTQVTSPEQAYLMIDIMKDVVKRGTGRRARMREIEVAAKTGTTNKNVDAWFNAYTPELEVITWIGKDNNEPINKKETGSKAASPAFIYFMKAYLKLHPETKRTFDKPKGVYSRIFNNKEEIFTKISKPPKIAPIIKEEVDNDIMF